VRLGILGGTFNPIHLGHLVAAQWVLESLHLTRVLFIPSATPPHKCEVVPYHHRSRMVELAIEDNPYFELCGIEAEREGPSYTADTLRELRELYGDTLYFIMGTEAFLNLYTWHQPKRVLGGANIVVMERSGFEVDSQEFQRYLDLLSLKLASVDFYPFEDRTWWCEVEGERHRVYLTQVPQIGISSSMVRSRLKAGLSVKYLVKGEVEEYIGEHGLYHS